MKAKIEEYYDGFSIVVLNEGGEVLSEFRTREGESMEGLVEILQTVNCFCKVEYEELS